LNAFSTSVAMLTVWSVYRYKSAASSGAWDWSFAWPWTFRRTEFHHGAFLPRLQTRLHSR